jgi:hypothetical protein
MENLQGGDSVAERRRTKHNWFSKGLIEAMYTRETAIYYITLGTYYFETLNGP